MCIRDRTKLNKAYELLGLINENLWIGHFDITSKNGIPAFRHTLLSNNSTETLHKKFEDLVDIGIYECEKFYPSFQQVLFDDIPPKEAIIFSNFVSLASFLIKSIFSWLHGLSRFLLNGTTPSLIEQIE